MTSGYKRIGVLTHGQSANSLPKLRSGTDGLRSLDLFRTRHAADADLARWPLDKLVLNGEIFNYRELRNDIADIPWRSETDTEVFVEAVARWGLEATLRRSNGMFAVALWDGHQDTLFGLLLATGLAKNPWSTFGMAQSLDSRAS